MALVTNAKCLLLCRSLFCCCHGFLSVSLPCFVIWKYKWESDPSNQFKLFLSVQKSFYHYSAWSVSKCMWWSAVLKGCAVLSLASGWVSDTNAIFFYGEFVDVRNSKHTSLLPWFISQYFSGVVPSTSELQLLASDDIIPVDTVLITTV